MTGDVIVRLILCAEVDVGAVVDAGVARDGCCPSDSCCSVGDVSCLDVGDVDGCLVVDTVDFCVVSEDWFAGEVGVEEEVL